MKYIDADRLRAEIERQQIRLMLLSNTEQVDMRRDCALQNGAYSYILSIIDSLQQEQSEANEVEKALSLQIQAYLTTASDELYAHGKPLYTKEHHEGIHECMKMWQKLHHYYFSTKQEQPEVDLEKEIDHYVACNFSEAHDGVLLSDATRMELSLSDVAPMARHFAEWGATHLNARKEE